jgi:pilus assembly protein FimV
MKKSMKISGLVWAMLFASGAASAAGLGKLTVQSALGQPLRAEIELLSVSKEELADISARIASHDAYKQARIDRVEALSNLRFAVDQRANGQPVIRITSSTGVADPFLDLLIELNWSSGRVIREYTILLDPVADAKPAETAKPMAIPEAGRNGEPRQAASAEVQKAKTLAPAPAPAAAGPRRYGPVRSGETLRAIAGKVKPAEVSLEQMMVGLYQANKGAFSNDNMNWLKRGQVLNVPEPGKVMATAPREAARTVRGHAVEWHAYRRKLAEMAGAVPQAEEKPAAGKITPLAEEKAAPAPAAPKDVLKLSKGEPGTGAGKADAKTQERLQTLEEEVAAKSRALQEAQDRVGQLERTVRDMQKLLELKAQEAAKVPAPAPVQAVVPPEPPKVETPAPAPVPPAPVAQQQPAPAPAPLPAAADSSSSWISTFISNPLYIGGLVAALLLSALLWMMMVGSRRRQGLTKFEDSIMTGGEFKNNVVFNPPAGAAPVAGAATEGSMLLTDFSKLGMGAIDSHEVDPIAEAEVYMAYGRDSQAEEILREALGKDPGRHEIALKLLEIYASRKDTTAYETTASELYAGLGGQNTPVWQRAAEMGRSIDSENPLYRVPSGAATGAHVLAGAAAAAAAGLAASVAQAAPQAAPASVPESIEDSGMAGEWPESPAVDTEPQAVMSAPDLVWETETLAVPEEIQAVEPQAAIPEPLEEMGALAEDILEPQASAEAFAPESDMSLFEAGPEAAPEPMAEVTAEFPREAPIEEAFPEISAQDLDLSVAAVEPEPGPVPELDLSGIDLDLETPEFPAMAEAPGEIAEAIETSLDFEPAGLTVAEAATPEPAAAVEAEAAESAMDTELREEVNTKLDLARAYLEMGDREGAREILQEVLNEGDTGQKAEAGKLMAEAG